MALRVQYPLARCYLHQRRTLAWPRTLGRLGGTGEGARVEGTAGGQGMWGGYDWGEEEGCPSETGTRAARHTPLLVQAQAIAHTVRWLVAGFRFN